MITKEELTREIELILDMMRNAPSDEADYLIGKLAALRWVQGMLRTDAHSSAKQSWQQLQCEGVLP